MRLRLHENDTIFISNEFKASVDENMFRITDNIIEEYKHILCDSIFYLESQRFGNLNRDEDIKIMVVDENE